MRAARRSARSVAASASSYRMRSAGREAYLFVLAICSAVAVALLRVGLPREPERGRRADDPVLALDVVEAVPARATRTSGHGRKFFYGRGSHLSFSLRNVHLTYLRLYTPLSPGTLSLSRFLSLVMHFVSVT